MTEGYGDGDFGIGRESEGQGKDNVDAMGEGEGEGEGGIMMVMKMCFAPGPLREGSEKNVHRPPRKNEDPGAKALLEEGL